MARDGRSIWTRMSDGAARLGRRWRGIEPRTRIGIRCERVEHGGWWICPQAMHAGDIVYSFNVGGDLRFERALIEEYGARVYAFDPDPETAARVETTELPDGLRFFEVGIGGQDRRKAVDLPGGRSAEARVLRLPSHMRMLGHRRLDLLRLGVPGAEMDVIRDLVGMDVDVHQVLISFREERTQQSRDAIEAAVQALAEHGYRVFHMSPDRRRFSLIRTDFAAQ